MRILSKVLPSFVILMTISSAVFTCVAMEQAGVLIQRDVMDQVEKLGSAGFFVVMRDQADVSDASLLKTKQAKGRFVYETLAAFSDENQGDLTEWLSVNGIEYKSYWIQNVIWVRGTRDDLSGITAFPGVAEIRGNNRFQAIESIEDMRVLNPSKDRVPEWNLQQINADDVWSTYGITGTGIVVLGLDAGVRWQHSSLINHYRGWNGSEADHNYNWFDVTGTYPTEPTDVNGHGTLTIGVVVGDDGAGNQVGVAPGAKWIAVKCMNDEGSGTEQNYLDAFQWALAPTDLTGNNPDPAMSPHVMNNSWGKYGGENPFLEGSVTNLRAAGILVEASAGNEGSACASLRSPGDYENVLTTGATTMGGEALSASSRGPSDLYPAIVKPNIVAPGDEVRAPIPTNSYGYFSGTSVSGPHTCGLVALLWSANPGLIGNVDETINIIEQTAIGLGDTPCPPWVDIPNNVYGWGELDCFAAVTLALATPAPTFTPLPCLNHGDVTLDGSITAGDAQFAFNIALGFVTPDYEEGCAADCNGSGDVTAGDAQQIFAAALGSDTCVDDV